MGEGEPSGSSPAPLRRRRGWVLLGAALVLGLGLAGLSLDVWRDRRPVSFQVDGLVEGLVWSRDGRDLAFGTQEGVGVWSRGAGVRHWEKPGCWVHLARTGDGLLVVATKDARVELRRFSDFSVAKTIAETHPIVLDREVAARGSLVALSATGANDAPEVHVWDVSGEPRLVSSMMPSANGGRLALSSRGDLLVFADTFQRGSGDVSLWDTRTGEPRGVVRKPGIWQLATSPAEDLFAGDAGARVEVRELPGGAVRASLATEEPRAPFAYLDGRDGFFAYGLAFSEDGQMLAVGAEHVRYSDQGGYGEHRRHRSWAEVWDLSLRERIATFEDIPNDEVYQLAFSPRGDSIAIGWGNHVLVKPLR